MSAPKKAGQRSKRKNGGSGGWAPKLTKGWWFLLAIVLLLAAYVALLEYQRPHVTGDPLPFSKFIDLAERDGIKNARILDTDGYVVGSYKAPNKGVRRYNTPYFKSEVLRSQLTDVLIPNRIPTVVDQQGGKRIIAPILVLLPSLMLIVAIVYFVLSYMRGTGVFGIRSGARKAQPEDKQVTFKDVAAQDAAVGELREVSEFLANPKRFADVGANLPKGILLYGPPGTGKTLSARALAGEAGASFYSISGSDFVEMYTGVGAARVRDLFNEARENAPSIVFIDELDSIARRRGAGTEASSSATAQEQGQALNQILAEMDGFSPMQGIIVVGATNRPETLDPALLRAGRFDRALGFELPDNQGRHAILEVHVRDKPMGPDVNLQAIAERSVGMTGADLATVVNEAGLLAARVRETVISQAQLEQALQRIMEAPERQRRLAMRDRSVGQRTLAEELVTFAAVAGANEAIEELAEVKEYLAAPDRFAAMGARIPRGYLLVGPPGCGKTLLARAVAGESNAAFISASATDFVEMFVGVGAGRVRDLFAEARSLAPSILFIDEIDAVGAARGASINDHHDRHQTLNQILIELDGFSQRAGVVVMAATNRPDTLDSALVRPGRFDRHVTMDLPDIEARRAILDVHAQGKQLAADADLEAIARLTRGMSGADLANIMNEAALLSARRQSAEVTMALLEEAVDRAVLGLGTSRKISEEDRRAVAYHEAGHGLVAMSLPGGRVLHKISIVPRGSTLAMAWIPEADDRYTHSRTLLTERMATLLAGRAAEELVLGEPGDGAANDLARVGEIARRMVSELGMSKLVGAINYVDDVGLDGRAGRSEETARLIDSEARRLVEEAGEMATRILTESRDALDRVAHALMERETLTLEQVEEIVGPATASAAGASGAGSVPGGAS